MARSVLIHLDSIARGPNLSAMLYEFALPTKAAAVPDGPNWFHEIKYDGYRLGVERTRPRDPRRV